MSKDIEQKLINDIKEIQKTKFENFIEFANKRYKDPNFFWRQAIKNKDGSYREETDEEFKKRIYKEIESRK